MQLSAAILVGGSYPGRVNTAPPPPTVDRPGLEPPIENCVSAALSFDRRLCDSNPLPYCLEPSERKLLTPPPQPPPPPPQKSDIQF